MGYHPIENYAIIGDLRTAALVAVDGSIDFMCFPRFDSPTIFARLLDDERGGSFAVAPVMNEVKFKQLYLPDSNILLTRFLAADGVAELSDFMPIDGKSPRIVRRIKTVKGNIKFRLVCQPRFNYARSSHKIERTSEGLRFVSSGPDRTVLLLRTNIPLKVEAGAAVATFQLSSNETAGFILEDGAPSEPSPASSPGFISESFKATLNFWRQWLSHSRYHGRWREQVNRSALVLKLLTSSEYGSLIASPTFGLPEQLGGERNWDYRYVWLRDAAFTVYDLMRLGYWDEATAFIKWLEARCEELGRDAALQVMYRLDGGHQLRETSLPKLTGYKGSTPVRIGNAAFNQLQLDIYGELLDAIHYYNQHAEPISSTLWTNLVRLTDWVCKNWRKPDYGIWEIRGRRKPLLYSRVMCWVALDRAVRIARHSARPAPLVRWFATRDAIYRDIFAHFWNPKLKSFVQSKHSNALDAACLLMPVVGFIGPKDPLWLSTLDAITRELVEDSLVHRYKIGKAAPDGLRGTEGTFSMCTFWYIECMARAGDLEQARFIFEKMLGYANHVGLYSEQLGVRGEHLGNFPQALTHLGLIRTVAILDEELTSARHL
jgi:GH15 family glucan-1,4-alpha-glucosidase